MDIKELEFYLKGRVNERLNHNQQQKLINKINCSILGKQIKEWYDLNYILKFLELDYRIEEFNMDDDTTWIICEDDMTLEFVEKKSYN